MKAAIEQSCHDGAKPCLASVTQSQMADFIARQPIDGPHLCRCRIDRTE